ncbi:MAG: radical SAM protein, partial [Firmicutes bacterium]|nr:radical SAM protein [Bacillota bacterium]
QAGHVYRPTRHRSPQKLVEIAKNLIKNSGYDEIGLSSLSSSDYPHLEELVDSLLEITEKNNISLSLPSLRIDNFSLSLMNKVQKVRKTGLTFAPEAGTQRMRDVINKGITEEEILNGAQIALRNGYKSIKLYFMIGLPYEEAEDIEGIPLLAQKILTKGAGQSLTVSVSSFVPKPHTPFQWARQDSLSELEAKQKILLSPKISRKIKINYHTSSLSVLEGVFARGDRRLCKVLERAVDLGCIFDGWSEYFAPDKWNKAFEDCDVDPAIFTRARSYDEILPWDIIDCGVTKNHLMRENEAAKKGIVSPNCRAKCAGCGAGIWKAGECV